MKHDKHPSSVVSSGFVRRLVEAREALRWTQEDLARVAGLQCTAISHFETGGRTPSLPNFVKLAKALRVSADWLLGLSNDVKGTEVIVNGERYVRSPNDQREGPPDSGTPQHQKGN